MRRVAVLVALAAAGGGIAVSPAVSHSAEAGEAKPKSGECASGAFCLWEGSGFRGGKHLYELKDVGIESCVPLPEGVTARSFGNRTGRPVTVYQSRECAETAEFSTHPSGSWTPEGEYRVRAVKFWEN